MRWWISLGGLASLGICLVGCGSGEGRELPDPGPDAGIDPSTPLSGLTPGEEIELCQWIAGRLGGYDRRVTCSDGDFISSKPSCPSPPTPFACYDTVGEMESCINGIAGGCTALPSTCLSVLLDCGMPMPNAAATSARALPLLESGPDPTRAVGTATAPAR
jgi:hypothetical protein